jgi:ligand-binding SRPBCC domain-containing protein
MKTHRLQRTQWIARPLPAVFAFFADASNLEQITPAFLRFRILSPTPVEMRVGTRIDYALSLFGLPLRWRSHITVWQPDLCFVDEQERGPYALWRHTHAFTARDGGTQIRDVVEYALPLGAVGLLAHRAFVARTLDRIFDHRRDSVQRLLQPIKIASRE